MQKYLYLTVFFSGMTSLAVEMAASRLLGNVFGTSNLVWASIIGLILIYLTLGYYLGGAWADRSPHSHTFFKILLWASLLIAFVPVISRPVLRFAADAFDQLQLGILFGSFTTVIILLCAPVTLLGTASPFAIKLAVQDTESVGSISGKIYAISTLGSFIGTFLPTLLLIPLIGTYRSFLVFSGVLMLICFASLWLTSGWRAALPYLWMLIIVPLLAIWGLPGSAKTTRGQIFETESSYNYIQVLEDNEYRRLRLNEGQGVHSVYHPTQLNFSGPWEQVLVAPFFNLPTVRPSQVESMAIIGLAAGTTARQAAQVFDNISIDGYEIDPKIVEVGREYFDMNQPNLNVFIQDGRWGLANSTHRYQVISVDAYRPPYIPWHLTTVEFFEIVHRKLTDDGVMVINVGRSPNSRRLINALNTTIRAVFPSTHVMDVPGSFNTIIFATVLPTDQSNLLINFDHLSVEGNAHPLLIETMHLTINNLQPDPPEDRIFTDDLAPVEWITNSMILEYLLFGDS